MIQLERSELMRILVTGGTGFTGTALVERLIADGHEVVALDNKPGLSADALHERGADVRIASITDRESVDAATAGVEVVYHLAAAFRELDVPESYYDEVNVGGTRLALEAARRHGVRKFVYCSTCGVHGDVADPPAGEEAPIAPADYYQRTKYEAEPIVASFAEDFETAVVRPAAIYGPGDPERFHLIFKQVAKGWFPMFGSGRTLYHPLYIDNLVDAFARLLEPGVGAGSTYLIADEDYWSIEEIVRAVGRSIDVSVRIPHFPVLPVVAAGHVFETVCRPLGIRPPIFPRRVDWYRQNRAFDISRAKSELGWTPRTGLDEGLRRTAAWYRETGLL